MDFAYDIKDLETFINGLRFSFDQLEEAKPHESKGFQYQIAKTISTLRTKKKSNSGTKSAI